MPFLKGEPLDDRLKREGAGDTDPADHFARAAGQRKPIPIPEALRIASEVASGLAVAHAQGLIHRDIKPANVWLEAPKGRAKILDFGLARSQDEAVHLTASGAILGTPAYMAPEQARGKPIDARADLFSLGVMLYEMVTGQRPFTGGDTMAILTSLALDDPTPPSQVNPAVSKDLSDYILKLLKKAPEKRPADAGAVSDALVVLQMRTARPVVEALPAAAPPAPPSATAVDPWGGLDEEVPAAAPVVSRSTKAATRSAKTERVVPRAKKVAATPDGPRRGHGLKLAVAAAALFLIGGGFAAYKLVFQTKDGTLLVEVDGDADVRFKNGELQIYDADGKVKYTLKPGQRSQAVSPGNYKVVVLSADGVRLETDKFEMTKAGKVTLRVTADAAAVAKKDPKSGPPEAAGYALEFEGNEGRVELPFRGPASKAFTIEAYLTRREHPPGHALSWPLYSEPTGLSAQNGVWNFWTRQEGDGFNPTNQITSPAKNNVPTHVAGVCTGAELLLFVDGKQVASKKLDGAPIAPGRDPVALGGKYFGAMREVRVSKVARYAKTFVPASRHEPDADTLALG